MATETSIEETSAADPASYVLETYTYVYQASYGSPEVDQTKPEIKSIAVAPDGRSARLVLGELSEGHVHELKAPGVRSTSGEAHMGQ